MLAFKPLKKVLARVWEMEGKLRFGQIVGLEMRRCKI